jgi:hypothetical protein
VPTSHPDTSPSLPLPPHTPVTSPPHTSPPYISPPPSSPPPPHPIVTIDSMINTSPFYTPPPIRHFTPAQRLRADDVQRAHVSLYHPSDASLSSSLTLGKFDTNLTSSDVANNRLIRGPCVDCAAGKYKHAPKLPSLSEPAQYPGEVLSFDPNKLPVPAYGSYTHFILVADKHTGFLSVVGALSKSSEHVFIALRQLITRVYNAHQHRVFTLHGDCESVNLSLIPHLGSIGCNLVASLPADHENRAERYTQTLYHVCIAMLASLPYILPKTYILNLLQAGADSRNRLVSPRTTPYTPNELVLHSPRSQFPFPFGSCCMVHSPVDKRLKLAQDLDAYNKGMPKMELGVCMGPDAVTGETFFLLENGAIVPRLPGPLLPPQIPFDWKAKPISSTPIATQQASVSHPSPPIQPFIPNTVIQLPDVPEVPALRAVTDLYTPSLPPHILHHIRDPLPLHNLSHTPHPPGLSSLETSPSHHLVPSPLDTPYVSTPPLPITNESNLPFQSSHQNQLLPLPSLLHHQVLPVLPLTPNHRYAQTPTPSPSPSLLLPFHNLQVTSSPQPHYSTISSPSPPPSPSLPPSLQSHPHYQSLIITPPPPTLPFTPPIISTTAGRVTRSSSGISKPMMHDSREGYLSSSRSSYLSTVASFLAQSTTSHLARKLANTRAATAVDSVGSYSQQQTHHVSTYTAP